MNRLERLLSIALMLSARRRLRADDLAGQFSVSVRTVYRDIRSLQDAAFPVVGTAGDGYRLPSETLLRPVAFDPDEAETLAMGAQLLDAVVDPLLKGRLQSAMAKLEAVLTPQAIQRMEGVRERLVIEPRSKISGPLAVLLEAVNNRQIVSITYDGIARGKKTKRQIEPLGLVRYANVWLVPAYCRLRQDLRTFRADRIIRIRLTGTSFALRPGHTFKDYIRMCEEEADTPFSETS